MSDEQKYCCQPFFEAMNGVPELGVPPFILYTPNTRLYGVMIRTSAEDEWIFDYCPFCGKKLPDNLLDVHFGAIRDPITGKVFDPLPAEFKSDLWWKKRGL